MAIYSSCLSRTVFLLCTVLLMAGCASQRVPFAPPDGRPLNKSEQAWPSNRYLVLAYHDVEDQDPDQSFLSVRTDHLVEQFSDRKSVV